MQDKYNGKEVNNSTSFKFSVIMPVYNTELYLKEAIDSIINQTLDFKENIQLILINDGSTDSSNHIIQEYYNNYSDNIIVLSQENNGPSNARNHGLKYVQGEYVAFVDSDDYISSNTLDHVYNFFQKHEDELDVVAIPITLFDKRNKEDNLNSKFMKTRVIDLVEETNNPQISIASTFIKQESFKNNQFNELLTKSEDSLLVNMILLDKKKLGVISNSTYYYRQRVDESALTDITPLDKSYYTHRLTHFHKSLINHCMSTEKEVPSFIQYMLAYDIQEFGKISELDVLETNDEKREFKALLQNILGYIGDNAILKNKNNLTAMNSFLMYLRRRKYSISIDENNTVVMHAGDYVIDKLNRHKIWLDIIEIRKGFLNISGLLLTNFYNESITIKLVSNKKKEYSCEYVFYPQKDRETLKFLSIPWRFDYNFNASIPLDEINESELHFEITFHEDNKEATYTPDIDFRLTSGMSSLSTYFVNDEHIVSVRNKRIYVNNYTYKRMLRRELATQKHILKSNEKGKISALFNHVIYMMLYPFWKNRKIWLINDRLDSADDNAKHLFKYALQQDDCIEKYFIISKECEDYKNMKKISNNVLAQGSFKHKMLYLFSTKRISSFLNEAFYNPFYSSMDEDYRIFYNGLVTAPRYFLQHGVISCDLTKHIKRFNHNLALIVTSADLEKQSFYDLDYQYPEGVVQALGLPRYDYLTTEDTKKQVVFMPSWRSQFDKNEVAFINSDYYHMINDLLKNSKLHKLLEDYGYELVFKPHPELVKHLDSFDFPSNVRVSTDESFRKVFSDSAILISDFSSVIFDFSYLKKPVIYYQKNDDYHYEPGYFSYETMGFGDIIKSEDDLVDKIKYYLENNCEMEDKYKERVTTFFKYNDKNNCKRVYEWIYND
ncbi:CDP-glycerol:glycerophosphate glycerophosphotransferase [Methanosphaera sp.]